MPFIELESVWLGGGAETERDRSVRAIATVYFLLLKPFPDSLAIGGSVSFLRRFSSIPPPWIMNCAITRWNTVLL